MTYEKVLAIIVNELKTISGIEGIFLSGSLANDLRDDFSDIEQDLEKHLQWFLFYVYDALKACKRGDNFQVQSLLAEMRKLLFFAVATYQGAQIYDSKRAYQYLTQSQRQILEDSNQKCDENVITQIARLYLESMVRLQSNYLIKDKVMHFQSALQELL